MNRVLAALFVLSQLVAIPGLAATGGTPLTLSHSGYLLDQADHPISITTNLKFRLFDAQGFGNIVWEASCAAVPVSNGYYTVVLGSAACVGASTGGLDPTLDTSDLPTTAARWLEVEVAGTTLAPRMAFSTVPTAAVATSALDADRLGGALPAAYHDAARLTGVAPASVLGTGSADLTTVGTITAGTWNGTPLADAFVAGASAWNVKLAAVTHDGTLLGDGTAAGALGVKVGTTAGSVAAGDDARFGQWSGTTPTAFDPAAARTTLGLGTAATANASAFAAAAQGATADAALPRAGGTMSGTLTLAGEPTADNHAATKKYVDAAAGEGTAAHPARSCKSLHARAPSLMSGPYVIDRGPGGLVTEYCDMEGDGGGWARCIAFESEKPDVFYRRVLNESLGRAAGRLTPTDLATHCDRADTSVEYRVQTQLDGATRSTGVFTAGAAAFSTPNHVSFNVTSSAGSPAITAACFNGTAGNVSGCSGLGGGYGSKALYFSVNTYADNGTVVGGYNYLYVENKGWHPTIGANWGSANSLGIAIWVRSDSDAPPRTVRSVFENTNVFAPSSGSYTGAQWLALLDGSGAQNACPAGYHPGNVWEYATLGILSRQDLPGLWVAGGFTDSTHYNSLINTQNSTVCPVGTWLYTYGSYRGVYGRVHCTGDASRSFLCVTDRSF